MLIIVFYNWSVGSGHLRFARNNLKTYDRNIGDADDDNGTKMAQSCAIRSFLDGGNRLVAVAGSGLEKTDRTWILCRSGHSSHLRGQKH